MSPSLNFSFTSLVSSTSLLLHCSVGRGFFGGAEGTEKWVGNLHRSAASLASADPLGRANCRPIAEVFLNSKDVWWCLKVFLFFLDLSQVCCCWSASSCWWTPWLLGHSSLWLATGSGRDQSRQLSLVVCWVTMIGRGWELDEKRPKFERLKQGSERTVTG